MVLKALKDDSGQTNIDFLFGISVLLLTFLYASTFIPGLFTPYQSGTIDLGSVAYRTSAILAEDPGWYIHDTANGTKWEQNPDYLSRIGLADDKSHPNVLSQEKIDTLRDQITSNASKYEAFRHYMGLDGSTIYDYNLSVDMYNTLTNSSENVLDIRSPDVGAWNVESINRSVMIDTGVELFVDCNNSSEVAHHTPAGTIYVDISRMITRNEDVTIRICNITAATPIYFNYLAIPVGVATATKVVIPLTINDYVVKLNGVVQSNPPDFPFQAGDTIEITFKSSAISDSNYKYLVIESSSTPFSRTDIDYYDDPAYKLKKVCYPGSLRLEVWSYATE